MSDQSKNIAVKESPPWFCGAFKSGSIYREFNSGRIVQRHEIDAVIASDRIQWRKRWYLWPFGYGALVELFMPQLRRLASWRIKRTWDQHAKSCIKTWDAEVFQILSSGRGAEERVQSWFDAICKGKADGQMESWMPSWSDIGDIVLPPSDLNESSQEIDNILVTDHGVYIIEVKGWRQIDADGSGVTKEGKKLGSPLKQSYRKRDHIRSIVGDHVPIHLLAALPNLSDDKTPIKLDSRIINSASQLSLVLRGDQQRYKGRPVSVGTVKAALLSRMDVKPEAKIRHMLWLAEHHPNEDALKIKVMAALVQERRAELELPFSFADHKRRPFALFMALFASLLLYAGWQDPEAYKRHGIDLGLSEPVQAAPAKKVTKEPVPKKQQANKHRE